jgi:hypothetical protein
MNELKLFDYVIILPLKIFKIFLNEKLTESDMAFNLILIYTIFKR